MLNKSIIPSIALLASLSVMPVWSAEDEHMHDEENEGHHVHEGDINPYRIGAEILLESQTYEADFGDLGGGAYSTSSPGIDADISKGAFESGNWLQFKPVAPLQFWDGDEWSSSVPNGETVNIVDGLGNTVSINATETSESFAVIGEIDSSGGIHTHIDFNLQDGSNSQNGSVGAYRIALKLLETAANSEVSVSYAASPVVIVFNQGLAEEQYEAAVAAAASGDSHEESAEAEYDADSGNLVIPVVKAGDKHYKVTLHNKGAFEFTLSQAEEITVSHDHEHEEDDHEEDDHEHEE